MGEIKFRAWEEKTNKMYTVAALYPWSKEKNGHITCRVRDDATERLGNNCKIMQYTGLKDKNGKEIYEGDIIKYITEKAYPITIDTSHGIRARIGKDNMCKDMEDKAEIIGNIYENPNLLK